MVRAGQPTLGTSDRAGAHRIAVAVEPRQAGLGDRGRDGAESVTVAIVLNAYFGGFAEVRAMLDCERVRGG